HHVGDGGFYAADITRLTGALEHAAVDDDVGRSSPIETRNEEEITETNAVHADADASLARGRGPLNGGATCARWRGGRRRRRRGRGAWGTLVVRSRRSGCFRSALTSGPRSRLPGTRGPDVSLSSHVQAAPWTS